MDSEDYFRLAPGKTVGLLKAPFPVTATSFDKDPATGAIIAVHAKYERPVDDGPPKKPKRYDDFPGLGLTRYSNLSICVLIVTFLIMLILPLTLNQFHSLGRLVPCSQ